MKSARETPAGADWRGWKHVLGRAGFGDDALVQKDDPVCDVARKADFMRDDHHRDAGIGKLTQEKQHFLDDLGIERGCRLIEKHQLRPHGKRACNGDALLLPARKPGGKHMGLVAQAETLQQGERLCFRFRPGRFCTLIGPFTMFSRTLKWGHRLNCWNTKPIFGRMRSIS